MTNERTHLHEEELMAHTARERAVFGFWIYIMSDCLIFACLFAAYAVLHKSTYGGPSDYELFSMPFVLIETFILLTSSFTYGLVTYFGHHAGNKYGVLAWLIVTLLLGASFIGMEVSEFSSLIHEGHGPDKSAFLTSFFSLVGTHGLHVTIGLIWMATLIFGVWRRGITPKILQHLSVLGLFWHFLDIIWIFIFTIVYLFAGINQ